MDANWLASATPCAGYFDIKITDETNTKAEKAQYIRETFAAFSKLLGNLHEVSYIYVEDVRATVYGYGGGLRNTATIIRIDTRTIVL